MPTLQGVQWNKMNKEKNAKLQGRESQKKIQGEEIKLTYIAEGGYKLIYP
jgi:hypothetical protein